MKKIIAIFTAILLICSVIVPATVIAEPNITLPGLYHEKFYKVHGNKGYNVTFDPENETITSSNNQTKSLVNYSQDMTSFDSTVTIQGNTLGNIYAGISFHVQDSNFTAGTFNSSGYSVIVKRNSETGYNTAKVIVRYTTGGSSKKEISKDIVKNLPTDKDIKLRLDVSVTDTNFVAKLYKEDGTYLGSTDTFNLDATAIYAGTKYYPSGGFALITNGVNIFSKLSVTAHSAMANIPNPEDIPGGDVGGGSSDVLLEKYDVYGETVTDNNNFTTATSSIARGLLKNGSKANFSADLKLRVNDKKTVKAGIIFRVQSAGASTDDMQGYSLIVDTTKDSSVRLYLYKYGDVNGTNKYLGRIGDFVTAPNISLTAGKELILHINVVDNVVESYVYDASNSSLKSDVLTYSLNNLTDSESKGTYNTGKTYYADGKIGFYVAKDSLVNAMAFTVGDAQKIEGDVGITGGVPAVDTTTGGAVQSGSNTVGNVNGSNIAAPTVSTLNQYAADFDNYTLYSSSTSSRFVLTDAGLSSKTTGAKRAMLDGVTVKGFHSTVTMRIDEEGTLRSGMVFRVNNIEKGLAENGTLASNDIEGYAVILYKTPGNTDDHARVVICVYKYGIIKGKYTYLGTVASKASTVPLTGYSKKVSDAAGQILTLDVNLIEDELTAYFYNNSDPSLKSEKLFTNLKSTTDIEKGTPSLSGIHYDRGAIGLTATDYVTFINFTLEEPLRESVEVGDLSNLDSYTIYGSGVKQEGEYITSNSSGTKKVIVNNLTVKDFKASMDMTIDPNGNLKTGIFFRVNELGNGADDQTGYAIIVTRNYSTNGEKNPNRIDIVLFKWGYQNKKLTYLGEVSREVYKSGASFVDGKMAGEELTFVVNVKGAAVDATLYHKANPTNKPVTFSTNLKFGTDKEKGEVAYFESGSIGLYLGNSVSDPVNYNKVRNFHIDDGSGVVVNARRTVGLASRMGLSPITGEGVLILVAGAIFVISATAMAGVGVYNRRLKRKKTGDNNQ